MILNHHGTYYKMDLKRDRVSPSGVDLFTSDQLHSNWKWIGYCEWENCELREFTVHLPEDLIGKLQDLIQQNQLFDAALQAMLSQLKNNGIVPLQMHGSSVGLQFGLASFSWEKKESIWRMNCSNLPLDNEYAKSFSILIKEVERHQRMMSLLWSDIRDLDEVMKKRQIPNTERWEDSSLVTLGLIDGLGHDKDDGSASCLGITKMGANFWSSFFRRRHTSGKIPVWNWFSECPEQVEIYIPEE